MIEIGRKYKTKQNKNVIIERAFNYEDEIKKIEKSDLKYPILIFVNDKGKFITIIDGHHRAQKAVRKGLKTIKAKLIPINSLPKHIRKVFSHLK